MTVSAGGSGGIVRATWEIRPTDGSPPIRGDLRALQGPPPATAVIICHGFKGFRRWGFFPALARTLAQAGHAAVTFDFSRNGVGADGVDYSALDLFAEATHSRDVEEIRMVLDAVTSGPLFPRPPVRIGLFGHSRGGGEAVVAAAEHMRVDALVTWAAISRFNRWSPKQIAAWERGETVRVENSRTGQQMPIGPGYWRDLVANADRLEILSSARRLRIPWLIVHGEQDETVPVSEGRLLYEAAGGGAQLLLTSGAGHTFGTRHPPVETTPELQAVMDATVDWYGRHLRPREELL